MVIGDLTATDRDHSATGGIKATAILGGIALDIALRQLHLSRTNGINTAALQSGAVAGNRTKAGGVIFLRLHGHFGSSTGINAASSFACDIFCHRTALDRHRSLIIGANTGAVYRLILLHITAVDQYVGGDCGINSATVAALAFYFQRMVSGDLTAADRYRSAVGGIDAATVAAIGPVAHTHTVLRRTTDRTAINGNHGRAAIRTAGINAAAVLCGIALNITLLQCNLCRTGGINATALQGSTVADNGTEAGVIVFLGLHGHFGSSAGINTAASLAGDICFHGTALNRHRCLIVGTNTAAKPCIVQGHRTAFQKHTRLTGGINTAAGAAVLGCNGANLSLLLTLQGSVCIGIVRKAFGFIVCDLTAGDDDLGGVGSQDATAVAVQNRLCGFLPNGCCTVLLDQTVIDIDL